MKLKQKPLVMVGPTLIGLYGLYLAIWGEGAARVLGAIMFVFTILYWIFIGFVITPKPPSKALGLFLVMLLVIGLASCSIPADPNPRLVNGIWIRDNPVGMNGDTLNVLTFWFNYTHQSNPGVDIAATDGVTTPADPMQPVSRDTTLTAAPETAEAASLVVPDNVIMARAVWAGTGSCIAGILLNGGQFIATAASPPIGIGSIIVTWGFNIGGGAMTLADCYNTFSGPVKEDAGSRWWKDCGDAYLTTNDWNMLNPAWEPASTIKYEKCVVYGWAADQAAALNKPVNSSGEATLSNWICLPNPQFPLLPNCFWR